MNILEETVNAEPVLERPPAPVAPPIPTPVEALAAAAGPRLNGSVLIDRKLIERVRLSMRSSVLRHRVSPAPESRALGKELEGVYLALGAALASFDDRRDLWGDRLEPESETGVDRG
jgi:hypothetical protein